MIGLGTGLLESKVNSKLAIMFWLGFFFVFLISHHVDETNQTIQYIFFIIITH